MEFADFVTWGFLGMISFIALRVVKFLDRTNNSIEELNKSIAVVIEKLENQEERIQKLEAKQWERR